MNRFCISVPVGAWHPLLPQCLESLRTQDADLKVALLDASNDPRVSELADQHDDWLSFRRHGPDRGQSDAIIEGWSVLDGDTLGWLNADDILMPGALAGAAAAFADDAELSVVYGHSVIINETGDMTGYHFGVAPPSDQILSAGIISQPSCFFRKDSYEQVGGLDIDKHFTMDWDLWIRLYKLGAKFGFIDQPLSQVMWGENTKTASVEKARRDELRSLIAEYCPSDKRDEVFRAFMIHGLADMIRPSQLRAAVTRRLRRNGPVIFGLGADGAIHKTATLYLAHYRPEPARGVRIQLAGDAESVRVESSRNFVTSPSSKGLEIEFANVIESGEIAEVKLHKAEDSIPVRFVRADWLWPTSTV